MGRRAVSVIPSWHDLAVILLAPVPLVLSTYVWPLPIVRISLSLSYLLFAPGYVALAALLPEKHDMGFTMRLGLSYATSVAVLIIVGLFLNYSPWGIREDTVLGSIIILVFALSAAAFWRRRTVLANIRLSGYVKFDQSQVSAPQVLSRLLILALPGLTIGVFAGLTHAWNLSRESKSFTEFYVLDAFGRDLDYPTDVAVDQSITVTLGVGNHEHKHIDYWITRRGQDREAFLVAAFRLAPMATWEGLDTFSLSEIGDNQKIIFTLHKDELGESYRSLHLWIDVVENSEG